MISKKVIDGLLLIAEGLQEMNDLSAAVPLKTESKPVPKAEGAGVLLTDRRPAVPEDEARPTPEKLRKVCAEIVPRIVAQVEDGRQIVVNILGQFGAKKLSEVADDKLKDLCAELQKHQDLPF